MFHPERWLVPELADHPAHLHINLLSGYRGSGRGREMISAFLASVAAVGAASCYLSVRPANVNAKGFYARLGWHPVDVRGAEPGTYLIHPTG
jgi:ribosomal protein S18 acetylase RimI-like enzyme